MIESIITSIIENKEWEWVFSGAGVPVVVFFIMHFSRKRAEKLKKNDEELPFIEPDQISELEPYKVSLGKRVRYIRENILDVNPRRFSDFLGINKVEELESYESGDREFPTNYVDQLCDFYFIDKEYIEGESKSVFRKFSLFDSDDSKRLIKEGFRPYILCQEGDDWLKGVIGFYKNENGCHRLVFSNRPVSFKSSGGGLSNLMKFLYPFVRAGMMEYDASVLSINQLDWYLIHKGLYHRKCFLGLMVDNECQDIFYERYEDCKQRVIRSLICFFCRFTKVARVDDNFS